VSRLSFDPDGRLPWLIPQRGARVFVVVGSSSEGLPCRTGTVVEAQRGGVFVRHDNQRCGACFSWGWSEVVPIRNAPLAWRLFGRLWGRVLRGVYAVRGIIYAHERRRSQRRRLK